MADKTPEQQLAGFLAPYSPDVRRVAREALARMRQRLPGAVRLVYDNYNALAIGFGPSEKASEAVFSIAVYPRWVSLFFLQGAALEDPAGLLKGQGNKARHIVLRRADDLDRPAVAALMDQALRNAARPLDPELPGRLVIKSVSEKKRSRRPEAL